MLSQSHTDLVTTEAAARMQEASKVEKLADVLPRSFGRRSNASEFVHLVPEFCRLLPVPLDMLYFMSLVPELMPPVERRVSVAIYLRSIFDCVDLSYPPRGGDVASCRMSLPVSLVDGVVEATTLYPSRSYERLEFVGDAVLRYVLSMNVMARNSSLQWDFVRIEEILSAGTFRGTCRSSFPVLANTATSLVE